MITQWAARRLLRKFKEFKSDKKDDRWPEAEQFKWFCEMEAAGYWEVRRMLEAGELG